MNVQLSETFFNELASKLSNAGLPEQQIRYFIRECREYPNYGTDCYERIKNHQMPSDDCFRTLTEAQKICTSNMKESAYPTELIFFERYLEIPYSQVEEAKQAMKVNFGCDDSEICTAYSQAPEWLLITVQSVSEFSSYLKSKFSDCKFLWSIYKRAALLGLEKTQYRINTVLEILGEDVGEKLIRHDLQGEGWLFYLWFTDPVSCIKYMLERGLTPERILYLLECEPDFLFEYKEERKLKYFHNQDYIDSVIVQYLE